MQGNPVLAGVLMALVGGLFSAWGTRRHLAQRELLANPRQVQGVVEETWIRRRSNDGVSYYPEVRYSYEFEGETYESEGIYPGTSKESHWRRSTAQSTLDELGVREGAPTTVYVDPERPDGGFLRPETTTGSNLLFALGGLGLACLGCLLIAERYGLLP